MNLDEAIQKHAEWKVRLRAAASKQERLDAAVIRRDNACALGKWLHGEGKTQFGRKASFASLIAKHADFHDNAGKVAEAINAKKYNAVETMLCVGSPYGNASMAVAAAITALKKEM